MYLTFRHLTYRRQLLLLIFLFAISGCSQGLSGRGEGPAEVEVTFLNVGQGDAAIITCPDRRLRILVDSGNTDELFLRSLREAMGDDRTITYAISTAPLPELMGGFVSLLKSNEFKIEQFIDSGIDNPASSLDETLRGLLREKGVKHIDFSQGRISTLEICPGSSTKRANMLFFPLSDLDSLALTCPNQLRDCSLMTRLEYKGRSVLFSSEVGLAREERLLADPALRARLRSDIFKVARRGSATATSQAFLEAVNPAYAVISSGRKAGINRSEESINNDETVTRRLNEFFSRKYSESRLFKTAEGGSITFKVAEDYLKAPKN